MQQHLAYSRGARESNTSFLITDKDATNPLETLLLKNIKAIKSWLKDVAMRYNIFLPLDNWC